MKNIITLLFLLFLFNAIPALAQKLNSPKFNYTGSHWEKYNGHRLTIAVLDTSAGGSRVVVDKIIRDGEFNVSGEIKYAQNAFFGLYNPNDDYVYKQEFILEPGKLTIDRDTNSNNIIVTGGKYNPIFLAIITDPVLNAKTKVFDDYAATLKQDDFKNEAVKTKYSELRTASGKYKMELYNAVRFNNPDPQARLLAIYHSDRSKMEEQLNGLEKELGPLPELVYHRYRLKVAKERQNNMVTIKLGSIINKFSANSLNGETFFLGDVLKENKYTLVEFWASWCGPCRVEIPHMKTAYEKFNKKGFQIVSFSLDHERERWMKASTEEKLPWINVGDLLAYKSPVVRMFGINGIPANYLVDQSGKIIAMNLRQEKLDEKLAELLGM